MSYRCDLVAHDETTGIKVIIENQLETTNHDHLGKIITYASGLDADVVIWIVKEAKEEHRSAVEWLNNKTTKDVSFFLIEIHAYQIGDSLPAPKFVLVEKPNDFLKTTSTNRGNSEFSKSEADRLNFWTRFNEVLVSRNRPFNVRKADTERWYSVAMGTSEAGIAISLLGRTGQISVELAIKDNKQMFDKLYGMRDVIENELGFSMQWQRLDNKKASRILYYIDGLDFDRQENHDELINEIIDKAVIMRDVFKQHI